MGKKIEFPKNYAIYTNKALKSLQSSDYEKAIFYLKKAYAIKNEESMNVLLVSSLFQNGQIREALETAEEKKSFYEGNERRLLVYVELLLANNNFLQAQKYIDDYSKRTDSPYHETWVKLDQELYKKRKETGQIQKEKEEVIVKYLFSLASVTNEEQFKLMNQADQLSTQNLQKVSTSVFNNPYVHPLAKSTLLSILIERKDSTHYSYSWFGKTKMIVPSHIMAFDKNEKVQRLIAITNQFFQQNPSLCELVMSELKLILLLLFPFIDDVISNEKEEEWVLVIADMLDGPLDNHYNVNHSDKEYIISWIEKVQEEL